MYIIWQLLLQYYLEVTCSQIFQQIWKRSWKISFRLGIDKIQRIPGDSNVFLKKILKSPIAFFLESKIWIVICTRHKILNTCSGLFFFFLILRQLINLLQSYSIPFRLIYGTQLRFLIAELPSTNQVHHPIKNEFTMGTAHWKLNNGLIFKLKLKYLLFCQLIQNSLWIIALPLLSKCYFHWRS